MNPLVILKLLDLAMLGFTAYERYREHDAQNDAVSDELGALRQRIMAGEVDNEAALAEIDTIIGSVISRRRKSFNSLPKPTGHS